MYFVLALEILSWEEEYPFWDFVFLVLWLIFSETAFVVDLDVYSVMADVNHLFLVYPFFSGYRESWSAHGSYGFDAWGVCG